jgi:hypothetical protein
MFHFFPRTMKKLILLLAGCLLSAGAFASCYIVMDSKGNVVSQSPNPPVDMSRQLHNTVPEKYGQGTTMTFGIADTDCGEKVDTWNDGAAQPKSAASAAHKAKGKRPAHHARPHHKAQPKKAAPHPKKPAAPKKAVQHPQAVPHPQPAPPPHPQPQQVQPQQPAGKM